MVLLLLLLYSNVILFWRIDLSLYLAATLICIEKKAGFRDLRLKFSEKKLNFEDQV